MVAIPNIENEDQCWLSKYVKLNQSYLFFSCDGFQLADDEITSATVGLVLDSLDDIHCITEAKHKDQVMGHTADNFPFMYSQSRFRQASLFI